MLVVLVVFVLVVVMVVVVVGINFVTESFQVLVRVPGGQQLQQVQLL